MSIPWTSYWYVLALLDYLNRLLTVRQDPDTSSSPTPSFLLRLTNDDELTFNFTFVLRQDTSLHPVDSGGSAEQNGPSDTVINGLTFIFAPTAKDVDNIATKELHADPNLHKNNPNVELVGDYSTAGNASIQSTWSWKWKPPRATEDRGGGWRNCCSFVEYDQRYHKLSPLANFSFWVQSWYRSRHPSSMYLPVPDALRPLGSPKSPSPRLEVPRQKMRAASAQSIDSRVSDSDGESKDIPPPAQSPGIEPIPEDGLGLVPSITSSTAVSSAPTIVQQVKVDVSWPRPEDDASTVTDGPLFRATIKTMEERTGSIKARWKKVLRRAEAALEAKRISTDSTAGLIEALREVSSSTSSAIQPAMEHYFDKIAKEVLSNERADSHNLQKMIIDPISRLYHNDIKQVEVKKADFEQESKEFYAYSGRYLGQRSDSLKADKKREERTDTKYAVKRRNFELKLFDYSSFMQDLHGGRKDQEVLSHLTKYADAQTKGFLATSKKIENFLPQLEALSMEVKEVDKELQLQRTQREEKRRALETSAPASFEPDGHSLPMMPSTPAGQIVGRTDGMPVRSSSQGYKNAISPGNAANGTVSNAGGQLSTSAGSQSAALGTSPGSNKFKGYRDLEEKDPAAAGDGAHRKEGLVWALSRPGSHADPKGLNKQAWHKYVSYAFQKFGYVLTWHRFWIVLDQGKLSEYTNWKQKLDLHMDPIDLRIASVREARNADRRFCFEIVTPSFTRVYQATSEEDMKSWIATINNALQSAVEGKGLQNQPPVETTPPSSGSSSIRKDIASVLTGKSASTGHRSNHGAYGSKVPHRNATVGDRPVSRPQQPTEISESSQRLLKQIRDADPANSTCADCGTDQKVDWVSINLGIVICIECSGIHRSLGTHISKVRSVTLDPNSFTPDVIDLLLRVGNRVSNNIWEAKLVTGTINPATTTAKPNAQSNRDQRLKFITAKYVDRAYVQPISATLSHFPTAEDTLLASIKKNDMTNVVYALALRANPNAHDKSRGTHAVFLALAAADPASPSASASPLPSPESGGSGAGRQSTPAGGAAAAGRKTFPVAELLLLNGAELPTAASSPIPLSHSAKLYLEGKAEAKVGRKPVGSAAGPANAAGGGEGDGRGGGVGTGGDMLTALPVFGSVREEKMRNRISKDGKLVRSVSGSGGSGGGQ